MTIGDKIRYQRKRLGLTQTELGEKLGVKTNAVSKWECGRVEDIPTSKVKAMAILFGVQPSYLIDDEKNPPAQVDERIWNVICSDSEKLRLVTWIASLDRDTFSRMEKILDAAFDL